jgi:hypothetical protein
MCDYASNDSNPSDMGEVPKVQYVLRATVSYNIRHLNSKTQTITPNCNLTKLEIKWKVYMKTLQLLRAFLFHPADGS